MIGLAFEPTSVDLLHSLLFPCGTIQDVGREFATIVKQGKMKTICELCSRTVQFSMIVTSHMWLFEFN